MATERVGELVLKDNGNLQFRYDDSYGGPSISHALPKQHEAHPHATTKAVFGGLLPEADVREAVARNLGVSVSNDYALLAELGGDVAGALTLMEEGQLPDSEPTSIVLSGDDLERRLMDLPQRPLAANPEEGIRLSLAGAQAKLPIIIDERGVMALPTSSAAATTHILKPEPTRFPGLVDNEAFCMDLARACGLQTAIVRKDRTSSGSPYLIVERYDRDLTTEPIRRLHQEDFCQALGRASDVKYQSEGGPSIADSVNLLRASTSLPAQELHGSLMPSSSTGWWATATLMGRTSRCCTTAARQPWLRSTTSSVPWPTNSSQLVWRCRSTALASSRRSTIVPGTDSRPTSSTDRQR